MIIIETEIFMQKETEKFNNSDVFEGMTSISAVINAIIAKTTDRKIISIYIDQAKKQSKKKEIGFLTYKSKELGFSMEFVEEAMLNSFTTGNSHGGIIAFCTPRTLPSLTLDSIENNGVYFMLDGVEDPYNFGYSIRSIYASGASGIVVPERNWMGVSGVVARSSAGTSELIKMQVASTSNAIKIFKKRGYKVICAGIRDSKSLYSMDLKRPLLVILGGEKRGISREILDESDEMVRIDYGRAFNGSLSTAASTAIFAFEILRQINKNE